MRHPVEAEFAQKLRVYVLAQRPEGPRAGEHRLAARPTTRRHSRMARWRGTRAVLDTPFCFVRSVGSVHTAWPMLISPSGLADLTRPGVRENSGAPAPASGRVSRGTPPPLRTGARGDCCTMTSPRGNAASITRPAGSICTVTLGDRPTADRGDALLDAPRLITLVAPN